MRKLASSLLAAVAVAAFAAVPAMAQDLVVATAGPITGQYAAFGEQMKRGAEMAIADINEQEGMTIFLVEQNAFHALRLAHRGYVLANGRVVLQGSGQELLANREVRAAYLEGGH